MRLNPKEIKAITTGFKVCLSDINYDLYLFGSRTNDLKKGGDIDLLIIVNPSEKQNVVNLKSKIRNEIFKFISEQKIDITVTSETELKTDEFLKSISSEMIKIDHSSNP